MKIFHWTFDKYNSLKIRQMTVFYKFLDYFLIFRATLLHIHFLVNNKLRFLIDLFFGFIIGLILLYFFPNLFSSQKHLHFRDDGLPQRFDNSSHRFLSFLYRLRPITMPPLSTWGCLLIITSSKL